MRGNREERRGNMYYSSRSKRCPLTPNICIDNWPMLSRVSVMPVLFARARRTSISVGLYCGELIRSTLEGLVTKIIGTKKVEKCLQRHRAPSLLLLTAHAIDSVRLDSAADVPNVNPESDSRNSATSVARFVNYFTVALSSMPASIRSPQLA